MTQEEKQLLLIDLCARMPYGVKVENTSFSEPQIHTLFGRVSDDEFLMLETYKSVGGEDYRRVTDDVHYTGYLESIKPYLRPMSSMTEEEFLALQDMCVYKNLEYESIINKYYTLWKRKKDIPFYMYSSNQIDYLISHYLDYRGLIEKGLALEAPEGMYKTE